MNIKNVLEEFHDVNVVIIRWQIKWFGTYIYAVQQVPWMADHVAAFLDETFGSDKILWKNLTLVGHSVGAHFAGE
jgi:pimeloyl-ACP methyl ester carboxylesterase